MKRRLNFLTADWLLMARKQVGLQPNKNTNFIKMGYEKQFLFDLPFTYERCLAGIKARNVLLPCRSGNDVCQHQGFPLGSFLKAYREEQEGNSLKSGKETSGHTSSLLAAERSRGGSTRSVFSLVVA